MGPLDPDLYRRLIEELSAQGQPLIDGFAMGLAMRHEPCEQVLRQMVGHAAPGVTYLSLHCSTPGEVERLHPDDAAWRIAEYRLFEEPGFLDWVAGQDVALIGFRAIREATAAARGRLRSIPRAPKLQGSHADSALVAKAVRRPKLQLRVGQMRRIGRGTRHHACCDR